ncbi:hypothetical protein CL635_02795 [bacterium]|nr:hypothetical protein [bacterium]|tara:strand:- start:1643 stop:3262 length:1620 start_codon:yes stop_codon:yes gene_type:complete
MFKKTHTTLRFSIREHRLIFDEMPKTNPFQDFEKEVGKDGTPELDDALKSILDKKIGNAEVRDYLKKYTTGKIGEQVKGNKEYFEKLKGILGSILKNYDELHAGKEFNMQAETSAVEQSVIQEVQALGSFDELVKLAIEIGVLPEPKEKEEQSQQEREHDLKGIDLDKNVPENIRDEFSNEAESSLAKTGEFIAKSGRKYVLQDGTVYYNSKPSEKNTWGNVEDDAPTFVRSDNGEFMKTRVGYAIDSFKQLSLSIDGNHVFDEKGHEIKAQNGVYTYPGGGWHFILKGGKLEKSDKTGQTIDLFVERVQKALAGSGLDLSFDGSMLGMHRINGEIPGVGKRDLFDVKVYSGGDKGQFILSINGRKVSSMPQLIAAGKKQIEKVNRVITAPKRFDAAKSNKQKFDVASEAFTLMKEVETTFPQTYLRAQMANFTAWMVVEDHMNGNTQDLKLDDAKPTIDFLEEYLDGRSWDEPEKIDTVAQYHMLLFKKTGDVKYKNTAIRALKLGNSESREAWDRLDDDEKKLVEANEELLKKLEGN